MAIRQLEDSAPSLDLDALYRTHRARVRALVRRRLSDPHLVEDAVQETFLRAHRAEDRFDAERPAWPWLATIASNVCTDMVRRHSFGEVVSDMACFERTPGGHGDPSQSFGESQRRQGVTDALAAVPARQRRVLLLKDHLGWRAEDIAAHETMHVEAVKGVLKRARARFRETYAQLADERGLWSAAPLLAIRRAAVRVRTRMRLGAGRTGALPGWMAALPMDAIAVFTVATVAVMAPSVVGIAAENRAAVTVHTPRPAAPAAVAAGHGGQPPSAQSTSAGGGTPNHGHEVTFGGGGVTATASNRVNREEDDMVHVRTVVVGDVIGKEVPLVGDFGTTCEGPIDQLGCDILMTVARYTN